MKIPSFIRLPKNKRFNFEPRYYDPIKEEIEERTSRIKNEMEEEEGYSHRGSISSAFRRKQRQNKQSNVMQFVFVFILVGVLFYSFIKFILIALFTTAIIFIILKIIKNKFTFLKLFKMAIFASTIMVIIETLNIGWGFNLFHIPKIIFLVMLIIGLSFNEEGWQ